MNDSFWMFPVFCVVVFSCLLTMYFGGQLEGKRIYDNCMESNKTMIHQEAVKVCKEIIK